MEFPYSLGRGKGYEEERFVSEETFLRFSDRLVGLVGQAL